MSATALETELKGLGPGNHVCWVVNDPAEYMTQARLLLHEAVEVGQKALVFGPQRSGALSELGPSAGVAVDPWSTYLDGGPLDPDAMFEVFREQSELARAEGYLGLRVVADMDWIVSARSSTQSMVAFELMLGHLAKELEATIVCAYRTASFDNDAIVGVLAVHEIDVDHQPPQFRLFASGGDTWQLLGEVDLAVAGTFETAISQAVRGAGSACVVEVSALEFIDVAGMRQIAGAARESDRTIRLVGASPTLRRMWELTGFAREAPAVELVDRDDSK